MMSKETPADTLFDALKGNPQEIIEWAESEIKEYKKLIRIIKKHVKTKKSTKT